MYKIFGGREVAVPVNYADAATRDVGRTLSRSLRLRVINHSQQTSILPHTGQANSTTSIITNGR